MRKAKPRWSGEAATKTLQVSGIFRSWIHLSALPALHAEPVVLQDIASIVQPAQEERESNQLH